MKKRVIDIHFNPQLPTCHPIFTPKIQRAVEYKADNERGQWGAEKERDNKRQRESDRGRLNFSDWMTYRKRMQGTGET